MDYGKYLVSEKINEADIHQKIKELLDKGKKVYSSAGGRVGYITKVDGGNVLIGKNPTSFLRGDKVELKKNKKGDWIVANK